MDFYRAWCDVGTEDEAITDEEREAAEAEAWAAITEEWDALRTAQRAPAPPQPTETTTPDGQPF
jgi:hypothetical protein